jgi:hypothetical protein
VATYNLRFYRQDRNRPVEEWLVALAAREQAEMIQTLDLLEEFGPVLGCHTAARSAKASKSCVRGRRACFFGSSTSTGSATRTGCSTDLRRRPTKHHDQTLNSPIADASPG